MFYYWTEVCVQLISGVFFDRNRFAIWPGYFIVSKMNPQNRLFIIKWVHTLIWLFFVAVIFHILYSGIFNKITVYTWVGIGLIVGEGIVLLVFKMLCPLTVMARKYSDSEKDNFDIFLPNWLAKHNKLIFTILYIIGVAIVWIRTLF